MNWTEIIIAITALYGAVLSTYMFIAEHRRKQRQLSLNLSIGFLTYGPELSEPMLFTTVANPGDKPVTINIPRIRLPRIGESIIPPIQEIQEHSDVTFPCELGEGKSCRTWLEIKDLGLALIEHGYSGTVKLLAEVEDGTGKIYKSKKPYEFDVDQWSKSR